MKMDATDVILALLVVLCWVLVPSAGAAADGPAVDRGLPDGRSLAEVAWQEFVRANRAAEPGGERREWETWATAALVFAHPDQTPTWGKVNRRVIEGALVQQVLHQRIEDAAHGRIGATARLSSSPSEVRYDRAAFDWITLQDLYNLPGQLDLYRRLRQDRPVDVVFPAGSTVIKVAWRVLTGKDDPSRFYTIRHGDATLGLVGFHVVSKHLPEWLWATFEQVDNPDRPLVASYDPYGYPAGDDQPMSDSLKRLFRQAGMDPELWGNYRLNGVQTSFVDATGRPEVLANSTIETGFTTRSSCMTCHSRATIGEEGGRLAFATVVGAPDPSWFWTEGEERQPAYLPLDFLWSLTRVDDHTADGTESASR